MAGGVRLEVKCGWQGEAAGFEDVVAGFSLQRRRAWVAAVTDGVLGGAAFTGGGEGAFGMSAIGTLGGGFFGRGWELDTFFGHGQGTSVKVNWKRKRAGKRHDSRCPRVVISNYGMRVSGG